MSKKPAALVGVRRFYGRGCPAPGQNVIWIWDNSGQITAGDYYLGKARDAAANYTVVDTRPTHWMPWPDNWPGVPATKKQAPAKRR
jgi:hypothetical protein